MDPLFDQDSARSGENRPAGGAPPTTEGDDDSGPLTEISEERPGYPDGAESVSPGPSPDEGAAESDAADGLDGAGSGAEPATTTAGTGEGDTSSPDRVELTPGDTTDASGAPACTDASIESEAGTESETPPAEPAPAGAPEPADPAATTTPSEPFAIPLPPAPTLAAPPPEEPAPAASPESAPVGPPPGSQPEPASAPSSAGPAPSQVGSQPPATLGVVDRVASQFRELARWPSPVRAHPDQRMSSLVMLVALAVTVGVVGAGVLVGLILVFVGVFGHG